MAAGQQWIGTYGSSRSKLLAELRVGRRRYVVDSLNPSTALRALIELGERVRCVVENSGRPPRLVVKLCGLDQASTYSILELCRKARGASLNNS